MTRDRSGMRSPKEGSLLEASLAAVGAVSLAAASAWIVYSNLVIDHHLPLPAALPAQRATMHSRAAGQISYYVDRQAQGRPLVLVHSINAAASAYEMSPLFYAYQNRRPVYALDLPGFGFSERSRRAYSPELYTASLIEFLESQVQEPADVIALSLGGEFVARAALRRPEWFHTITLLSPTGFSGQAGGARGSQQAGQNGLSRLLHPLFAFPLWSRPFYDLLTTRRSIRYFLEKSFFGPPPEELIEYAYLTAHQPGAEHAPLYFISGQLFTPQVRERVYQKVTVPTLVVYDRDNFTSFERLPDVLTANPYWSAARIAPTLGLPHFERLPELVSVLERFWQEQTGRR